MSTLAFASDDFNRQKNVSNLGSNWTDLGAGCKIVSNQVNATDSNGNGAYYNVLVKTFAADQYSQATMIARNSSPGVCVRMRFDAAGLQNYYTLEANALVLTIGKVVAGVFTQLASFSHTFAANDILRLQVRGTLLTGFLNGLEVVSATDSALTMGQPGIALQGTGDILDNWSASDIGVIAYVSRVQIGDSVAHNSIASPAKTHAAHSLLVALVQRQTAGITSISSTADGSAWLLLGTDDALTPNRLSAYYIKDSAGGINDVVTVNFDALAGYQSITVYEFSGCDTSSPSIGGATHSDLVGSLDITSTSVATVAPREAVIVMFIASNTHPISDASGNYNLVNFALSGDSVQYFADGFHIVIADEEATATGTAPSGTWTCMAKALASPSVAIAVPNSFQQFGVFDPDLRPQGWFDPLVVP